MITTPLDVYPNEDNIIIGEDNIIRGHFMVKTSSDPMESCVIELYDYNMQSYSGSESYTFSLENKIYNNEIFNFEIDISKSPSGQEMPETTIKNFKKGRIFYWRAIINPNKLIVTDSFHQSSDQTKSSFNTNYITKDYYTYFKNLLNNSLNYYNFKFNLFVGDESTKFEERSITRIVISGNNLEIFYGGWSIAYKSDKDYTVKFYAPEYISQYYKGTFYKEPEVKIINDNKEEITNDLIISDLNYTFYGQYINEQREFDIKYFQFTIYDKNKENIIQQSKEIYSNNIKFYEDFLLDGEYIINLKIFTQNNLTKYSEDYKFKVVIPSTNIDLNMQLNYDGNEGSMNIELGNFTILKGYGNSSVLTYKKNSYNNNNTVEFSDNTNIYYGNLEENIYLGKVESTLIFGIILKDTFTTGDIIEINTLSNNIIKVILDEDYKIKLKINNIIYNNKAIALLPETTTSAFQNEVPQTKSQTYIINNNDQWEKFLITNNTFKGKYLKIAIIPDLLIENNINDGYFIYLMN